MSTIASSTQLERRISATEQVIFHRDVSGREGHIWAEKVAQRVFPLIIKGVPDRFSPADLSRLKHFMEYARWQIDAGTISIFPRLLGGGESEV